MFDAFAQYVIGANNGTKREPHEDCKLLLRVPPFDVSARVAFGETRILRAA